MNKPNIDHPAFPKIPRLNREVCITEKLDGTNAIIHIDDSGEVFAGSRNRWLTPAEDNYGFARWVEGNQTELIKLGAGTHYGEWWGQGIQRNYGLKEKRFSLFNVGRWSPAPSGGVVRPVDGSLSECVVVGCCHIVPTLAYGPMDTEWIGAMLNSLSVTGSVAAPGFMDPEGIVVFHAAARQLFKVTCKNDASPKGVVNE